MIQTKGKESEALNKNWRDHGGQAHKNRRKQNRNISGGREEGGGIR